MGRAVVVSGPGSDLTSQACQLRSRDDHKKRTLQSRVSLSLQSPVMFVLMNWFICGFEVRLHSLQGSSACLRHVSDLPGLPLVLAELLHQGQRRRGRRAESHLLRRLHGPMGALGLEPSVPPRAVVVAMEHASSLRDNRSARSWSCRSSVSLSWIWRSSPWAAFFGVLTAGVNSVTLKAVYNIANFVNTISPACSLPVSMPSPSKLSTTRRNS